MLVLPSTLQQMQSTTNNTDNLLTGDIDIHQRRAFLLDPTDPHAHLASNILVYCANYYPHTKNILRTVILRLAHSHPQALLDAITHLHTCLEKEVISGPSSSHIPPAELPHLQRNDIALVLSKKSLTQLSIQLAKSADELNLADVFGGRTKELVWYGCSRLLSMKSVQQFKGFFKLYERELEIDGESWLQSTPFPSLFCVLEFSLKTVIEQGKLQIRVMRPLRLIWARLVYLHNKLLQNPVKQFCQIALTNYKWVIAESKEITLEDYVELLLEYSFCLLFYYKYNSSEAMLRHCSNLLLLQIQFTGKLGRRTKYQCFDTPQLVMNMKHRGPEQAEAKPEKEQDDDDEGNTVQLLDARFLVARERGLSQQNANSIKPSTYDEESILLETPKFVEEEGQKQKQNERVITEAHLLVTLASIYFQWRSTPHDEMLYQHVSASIMSMLKYNLPTSYSYNFATLLLRSLNEFPRIKHTERALDQLEKLKATYNNRGNKSVADLHSTPYQTHLGFVLVLADRYMEMGLSLTAVDLFEQAGLFEQCIDGLIKKNYKEKAQQLLERLISERGHNPRTLCMLGDINGNKPQYYEQAWKLSKQTNARSQRSLGWLYFNQSKYEQAANAFLLATQASYYHPSTWFTLGCCYMRFNNFDKALKAFSECISIDDTQGEAWGNMASCYMYQKKYREAYSTLEQAVRYSESNWKLWANLLAVSISIKKFYKYFECIDSLVKLGHQEVLTNDNLNKVVLIMRLKNECDERRRVIYNFRNRIDRLFDNLATQIGQNPIVWKARANYQLAVVEYYQVLHRHYKILYDNGQQDVNDLIPGYENLESTNATTIAGIRQAVSLTVQYKQCELNMVMKVGWHQNKIETERVKLVLEEYVEFYRKYSGKDDKNDFKLFVGGVVQKIAHCLQTPYKIDLEWLQ